MKKATKNIIILTKVTSSNNYAIKLINNSRALHGTVIMALCQERGRGQQNNIWESAPGMNLLASIILFPRFLSAENQFYLSMIASLAIVDLLKNETGGISIKWPNDIYFGDKKICGILIENMIKGNQLDSAVVGVGLNLNQVEFSPSLPNPVSLKLITGRDYSIEAVMGTLKTNFFSWYDKLESGNVKEIDTNYYKYLFRSNVWSRFRVGSRILEGRISGIDKFGQLIIEEKNGLYSKYMFKEIEYVI